MLSRSAIYIAAAFAVLVICVAGCFEIFSPDLYWHLKMGRDLLDQGLSPFRDHYSFTYPNEKIIMVAWPFQIAISSFFNIFGGLLGVAIFRILIWTTALYFNFRLWRRLTDDKIILFFALLIFLFTLVYHSEPRPDHITLLLMPVLILLLMDWRRDPTNRQSLKIGLLMLVWSNIHVSSMMGYVCIAGFLVERALFLGKSKQVGWWRLVMTGAAWIAVGFLNADLMHPFLQQATLKPEWADYITEYQSFPFAMQFPTLQLYWIFLAFAGTLMLYRKEFAGAFIAAIIGLKTWEMTKLFPHLMIMTLPFVISSLDFFKASVSKAAAGRARRFSKSTFVVCMLLANIFVFVNVVERSMIQPMHPIRIDANRNYFPFDLVKYAKSHAIKGNMINEYGMGGFLLHELSPDIKVYIDGRSNILFPLDHMIRSNEILVNTEFLKSEVAKYDVKYVVGWTEGMADLVSTALDSGLFSIAFLGQSSALLERTQEKPDLFTKVFLNPECLDAKQIPELEALTVSVGAEEPLKKMYLDSALRILKKSTPSAPPTTLHKSIFLTRLSAEGAWRENDLKTAFELIGTIPRKNAMDMTNFADLDCQLNGCSSAEAILANVPKAGLTPDTLVRGQKILEKVRGTLGFRIFTEERYAALVARVKKINLEPHRSERMQMRSAGCR